ncbi:MAG: phosphatase PAP2 family protein [Candidatus Fermentibacteraceae bacterium]|nr:phosphatase PAP2 family protein [Candidatus Fermentibacteraceae bacterium]MBN2609220.1 phosphatase PAP2 family protein [Candidatus Fermentibacteraceae bacterium]
MNGRRTLPLLTAAAALFLISGRIVSGDFLPSMGEDIHELLSREPLLAIGIGIPVTAAALVLEDPAGNPGFMGDGFLDDASLVCHHSMGLPLLGASAALWGAGSLDGSGGTEETGQMLTEGLLLTYGVAGVLKLGTARERPDGSSHRSFPSVHAAGTACAAVILWDRYGAGAGVPAAALSVFTALSRVHMGKHYPSDVLAGAAIGVSVGLAVAGAHCDEAGSPRVQPSLGVRWSSDRGFGVYF